MARRGIDTILGHCIARAVVRDAGGLDAMKERYGPNKERWSTWAQLRAVTKATPQAMRVATFIVCWALGMWDEGKDSYSITEYQRYWKESERQAYRVQDEFRELWPEFRTPNELAAQIVTKIDKRMAKRDAAKLPQTLTVEALTYG